MNTNAVYIYIYRHIYKIYIMNTYIYIDMMHIYVFLCCFVTPHKTVQHFECWNLRGHMLDWKKVFLDPWFGGLGCGYLVDWRPGHEKNLPSFLPTSTTPPKINMEHNHGGLEDDFPFQIGDF